MTMLANPTVKHYATGLTPGCGDCVDRFQDPNDHENLDYDAFFSWSPCQSPYHQGEHLGGARYFAHEVYEDGTYEHLTVCEDCYLMLSD